MATPTKRYDSIRYNRPHLNRRLPGLVREATGLEPAEGLARLMVDHNNNITAIANAIGTYRQAVHQALLYYGVERGAFSYAKARERNPDLTAGEQAVAEQLAAAGLDYVPELAVNTFNIDLALPERKLAIEVQGGNWHNTPDKIEGDARKREALEAAGWTVVEFWGSEEKIRQEAAEFAKHL